MKNIVVIGSANADRIMALPHLPAVGETVTEGVFSQAYGGKGANQAVAAARAGGSVAFISAVGDDAEGAAIRENCVRDGIVTTALLTVPGVPTGAALVLFDTAGRNYLAVAPGANYSLTPEDIALHADTIRAAAYVVMQMEIPVDTTLAALEIARTAQVPVLFNFAPVRTRDVPVTNAMTGLIVNENEAAELTGLPMTNRAEAEAGADALLARGPRFVIVTLGADGAWVAETDGARTHLPAFEVTPVDTTAAGDTFCGALAAALTEGQSLAGACRFAQGAAALSVTKAGAQSSIPYRAEIEAFLLGH